MTEAYSVQVLDHFQHPRHCGKIADANGVGDAGNPRCGDTMRLYVRVADGVVADCGFKVCGCGAAVASASMATVLLVGKTLTEAAAITDNDVVDALGGLPQEKRSCSVLAQTAIRSALADYYRRAGEAVPPMLAAYAEAFGW